MRQSSNLGLALYDQTDLMNITGSTNSLNHNMELIDSEVTQLKQDVTNLNVFVTPEMYGAKGDGTTDDTEAFQTVLGSFRRVFVPGGTYKLSGTLTIRSGCALILSSDTVLDFTQTAENCIEMKMSAYLSGHHAVIRVPYAFSGNVVHVSSALDSGVADVPPYTKWDPMWKTGRYLTDLCVTKPDERGFHYSIDGTCSGKAVYIEADSNAVCSYIWGLNFSGLRIAGAFSYGIHAKMIGSGWCHEMRLEAFIDACEIGVCMEDCKNSYISATVQPRAALTLDGASVKYAKHGIQLIRAKNTDLSGSRVWDWNENSTLWTGDTTTGCIYQHISMIGECRGTILNDFLYYETSYDLRNLIYTDTPSNLEKMTILQEPFTRWFHRDADNFPMFFDGKIDRRLLLKEELDQLIPATLIPDFTNLLPLATAADGSVFNEKGYKEGVHLGNDGVTEVEGREASTGYIAVKQGDVIRLKGMSFAEGSDYCKIILFDSSKTKIMHINRGNILAGNYYIGQYQDTEDGCSFKILQTAAVAYMRLSVAISNMSNDPIVTVNQEISYNVASALNKGILVDFSQLQNVPTYDGSVV